MARKHSRLFRETALNVARVQESAAALVQHAELRSAVEGVFKNYFADMPRNAPVSRADARGAARAVRGAAPAIDATSASLKRAMRLGGVSMQQLANGHYISVGKQVQPIGSAPYTARPKKAIPLINRMRYTGYGNQYAADVRKSLVRQLSLAATRGETPNQALARMAGAKYRTRLRRAATMEEKIALAARAVTEKFARRAELIVRNEMFATYNAVAERAISSTGSRRLWVAALDYRICAICRLMDGKTVAADESFLYGEPPIHVNCRCIVVPAPV